MGGVFVDTIKRVQDLMQARDMNLCVCWKRNAEYRIPRFKQLPVGEVS